MTDAGADAPVEPTAAVPRAERAIDRATARIRRFAAAQPDARATIAPLGSGAARVVLVSTSGVWGDVVVRRSEYAEQACERAGVPVTEWDRETAAQVDLTAAYRIRMAGTGR